MSAGGDDPYPGVPIKRFPEAERRPILAHELPVIGNWHCTRCPWSGQEATRARCPRCCGILLIVRSTSDSGRR
jgi:hypothetical protein